MRMPRLVTTTRWVVPSGHKRMLRISKTCTARVCDPISMHSTSY
jgi:hypothetical protein